MQTFLCDPFIIALVFLGFLCFLVFSYVSLCFNMLSFVFLSVPGCHVFSFVFLWFPLCSYVFLCFMCCPMCSFVFLCVPVLLSTICFLYFPVCSCVSLCFLMVFLVSCAFLDSFVLLCSLCFLILYSAHVGSCVVLCALLLHMSSFVPIVIVSVSFVLNCFRSSLGNVVSTAAGPRHPFNNMHIIYICIIV